MLSPAAATVRRHDPDRFLTALFAPAHLRETLFVLYAFNHELARAREMASQPHLALIRLHWWREVGEGQRKRHETATPLSEALDAGLLPAAPLLAMVDAREAETAPIADRAAFDAYVRGSAGSLAVAAGHLLGAPDPEALRDLGTAYGIAGILRSVPALARQGRCLLPDDLLAEHGLSAEGVIESPETERLGPVRDALQKAGRALLLRRPALPRQAIAAALPAVLARRDLVRPLSASPRGLADRLAVMAAGWRGLV